MLTWILLASMFVAQGTDLKLVADAKQLMYALVIPASDFLFHVPLEVPEDDAGWAEVENNAIRLAESGTLLLLRADGRAPWAEASRALVEAGEATLAAARERDVDRISDLAEDILAPCSDCHDLYLIDE